MMEKKKKGAKRLLASTAQTMQASKHRSPKTDRDSRAYILILLLG